MQSDSDNDENDQRSSDNSSGNDDEMSHTWKIYFCTSSNANANNITYRETIKQDSLCEKIQCS